MTILPFDDRDGWIWMDGQIIPWREAKVHVLTHGLHYASSVFEGERMYGGQIFKLNEHTERLFASAQILDFDIPFTVAQINQACIEICAKNGLTDAYVRPIAWRGSEMMAVSAQSTKIHMAIAAWDWPSYFDPATKAKGIRLTWAKYKRPSPETEPVHSKASGLYMICTICKHAAERDGYADALFLDWRGYVAEATGANVMFVLDGAIHTPTPDCFLDGITRRSVIALAKANGIEVIERHISKEDLATFTECFLVGSAAEVTPVSEVGEFRFTPGKVSLGLMEQY
ncbi:MAG: branched-chain amino acid aminotransferase, partial [Alphaproteobacteria bacterium]